MVTATQRQREYLRGALEKGTLSHAYIISGAADKAYPLAVDLAKLTVCTGKDRPCGNCVPCRKVDGGFHPDVITLTALTGKSLISVEQVRELCRTAAVMPNEANKKIYIIKDIEKMTAAGHNALLKVLEEPPAHVMFILTCEDSGALPETVLSRCVKLRVEGDSGINTKNVADYEAFFRGLTGNNKYAFASATAKWAGEKDRDKLVRKLEGLAEYAETMLLSDRFPQGMIIAVIEAANKAAGDIAAGSNKKMSILSFIIDSREVLN